MFIKRIYASILDDFFPRSTFFKPTGDGLMIVQSFTERTLKRRVQSAVASSLRLLDEFDVLTANDPMVNFPVPKQIGIGMTRGATCRLRSGAKTLDYSGRVLNLTSRLMHLARPYGLVFDSTLGPELLDESVLRLFETDTVFIRGIAEESPVTIYCTQGVSIPEAAKTPPSEVDWPADDQTYSLEEVKGPMPTPTFHLLQMPIDSSQIRVKIIVPNPRQDGRTLIWEYSDFEYYLDAGRPTVKVRTGEIAGLVQKWGVRRNKTPITIRVTYPVPGRAPRIDPIF